MNWLRSVIYQPQINWILRNVCKLFSVLIPEHLKLHPSGSIKVRIGGSSSFMLKTNPTSYITRQIFWNGPMAFEYTPIFKDLINKVDTFWDIGANIGYYSVLGSTVNPQLKVRAFEPSEGPKKYLEENIRLNGLSGQIQLEPIALSNFKGEIEFHQIVNPKFPSMPNLSGEHNMGTKKNLPASKVQVKTFPLDDYVPSQEKIDLIKIDTEGAEVEILKGSIRTITAHQPIIIVETLFNKNEAAIEAILKDLGYAFYNHTQKGLQKTETLIRSEDDGVRDCFCVTPSKKSLIEEFVVN
ncbi:FkbM family methyltransferase [Flagellimonas myxillae]|uniref:FkbM family methyltransferase n=1 Tax=Flagellimonas myxillae TaxID=2942214 RepID=UPI00201EB3CE|nr:FkbM family methyltransferase [Muricauda myxillae]MCL6265043.1 FkbM family methyltransferase [Muricauda myxillae]